MNSLKGTISHIQEKTTELYKELIETLKHTIETKYENNLKVLWFSIKDHYIFLTLSPSQNICGFNKNIDISIKCKLKGTPEGMSQDICLVDKLWFAPCACPPPEPLTEQNLFNYIDNELIRSKGEE